MHVKEFWHFIGIHLHPVDPPKIPQALKPSTEIFLATCLETSFSKLCLPFKDKYKIWFISEQTGWHSVSIFHEVFQVLWETHFNRLVGLTKVSIITLHKHLHHPPSDHSSKRHIHTIYIRTPVGGGWISSVVKHRKWMGNVSYFQIEFCLIQYHTFHRLSHTNPSF